MGFLASFGSIALFLILAIFLGLSMILIPWFLTKIRFIPHRPNPVKYVPYESGMDTIGKTWVQFNFRYYFFALLFVLFDIEVVFFYPWAAAYQKLGLFALGEMAVFVGILLLGYIYAWRKGALEWK